MVTKNSQLISKENAERLINGLEKHFGKDNAELYNDFKNRVNDSLRTIFSHTSQIPVKSFYKVAKDDLNSSMAYKKGSFLDSFNPKNILEHIENLIESPFRARRVENKKFYSTEAKQILVNEIKKNIPSELKEENLGILNDVRSNYADKIIATLNAQIEENPIFKFIKDIETPKTFKIGNKIKIEPTAIDERAFNKLIDAHGINDEKAKEQLNKSFNNALVELNNHYKYDLPITSTARQK